ncbi:MAG TPA: 1-acyl-sn-glycerol-3-phosphate acyltransferase [Cyclobacteriaceae bacterium]|nr:1-acyl-sn-glycerol-3-phosphate acyltransferase [Cyclobacteriaceae bacterium]
MLYYWLKFMMRMALSIYYRKRIFTGFDNVPATGPAIFACNHPNSFLDAMIIGAYIKRETHFLARSDVFNSPLKLWILSQFKLIPIYRLQEGAENLNKNKETFERCHAIFRKGGTVLMFSEGLCIQEMRLRPLKKGTARIALEYAKDGAALTIIPTGLNYMKPTIFRQDILISMDTPFNAADYAAEFNENSSKGIASLNKRLETGLQNSVIDINDKQKEKEIVQLIEVEYNNGADLTKLVHTVKQVNELQKADANVYNDLISLLGSYKAELDRNKVDDETVVGRPPSMLWLVPALLIFSIAIWLYVVPLGPAVRLVSKKVRLAEFKDSVLIGASVIFVFFFWLIAFIVVSTTVNVVAGVQVILIFLLVGSLTGPCYDVMLLVRTRKTFESLPDRSKIEELRKRVSASILNLVKTHQAHHPVG